MKLNEIQIGREYKSIRCSSQITVKVLTVSEPGSAWGHVAVSKNGEWHDMIVNAAFCQNFVPISE